MIASFAFRLILHLSTSLLRDSGGEEKCLRDAFRIHLNRIHYITTISILMILCADNNMLTIDMNHKKKHSFSNWRAHRFHSLFASEEKKIADEFTWRLNIIVVKLMITFFCIAGWAACTNRVANKNAEKICAFGAWNLITTAYRLWLLLLWEMRTEKKLDCNWQRAIVLKGCANNNRNKTKIEHF